MPTQPSFDTWTIIFLVASVQGFFLALVLFARNDGNRKANGLLSLLIFLFSFMLLYYVAYWTGYANKYVWMNGWVIPITFLFGPLTYYYIRVLDRSDDTMRPSFTWQLLPYILQFIFMLPTVFSNVFTHNVWIVRNILRPHAALILSIMKIFIVLQCVSLLLYVVLIFLYIRTDKQKLNAFALQAEKVKHHWLIKIGWFFGAFSFASVSYWLLVWAGLLNVEYDYAISVAMSVFIYMVGYMGFMRPEIFHSHLIADQVSTTTRPDSVSQIKYERSSLKVADVEKYMQTLLQVMDQEKPWMQNALKIQQLAELCGLSSHHLSQLINERLHQNFPDFINTYRIAEAKRLLSDADYEGKILAIAFDSGYQNKATFNTAFKKATGMSPSEYRRSKMAEPVE